MKFKLEQDYRELRRDAYPSLADQLDAIWKGGQAFADMQKRVLDVKDRYPKNDVRS